MKQGLETLSERLRRELHKRCEKNPRYSLRAFARFLAIEPSALSKILHGKRIPSERTHQKLVDALGIRRADLPHIVGSAAKPMQSRSDYVTLPVDLFRSISEWHHYAILELTRVEDFTPDARWIAKRLGIELGKARAAIERLFRMDLLALDAKGAWVDRSEHVTTVGHAFTNDAFRALQRGILERAIHAMEAVPIEKRDQSSMTMAADSARVKVAKERIKKFRRSLCKYLQGSKKRDTVYQLSVSLFPVTAGE